MLEETKEARLERKQGGVSASPLPRRNLEECLAKHDKGQARGPVSNRAPLFSRGTQKALKRVLKRRSLKSPDLREKPTQNAYSVCKFMADVFWRNRSQVGMRCVVAWRGAKMAERRRHPQTVGDVHVTEIK